MGKSAVKSFSGGLKQGVFSRAYGTQSLRLRQLCHKFSQLVAGGRKEKNADLND